MFKKYTNSVFGLAVFVLLTAPLVVEAAKGGKGGKGGGIKIEDPCQSQPGFDVCISGTPDSEQIYGTDRRDFIDGGDGRDEISALDGDDLVFGGLDGDTIDGGVGADIIWGGDGTDWLDGGPDVDQLYGEAGEDRLAASPGPDLYDGGTGNDDWISFHNAYAVNVTVGLMGSGTFDAVFSAGQTPESGTYINIERVWGSPGDDELNGSEQDDVLIGDDGDDLIYGNGGNDIIHSEHGDDVVYGGPGNDTITGWGGNDTLDGGDGDDSLSGPGGSVNNDDQLIGGPGCDKFVFSREFGRDTIVDFEQGCEKIDFTEHTSRWFSGMSDVDIYPEGSDLIVVLSYKAWGESYGGTIVIQNGAGLTLTAGDFLLP